MKYNKNKILKAIKGSYGNITTVANELSCERKTVYEWLKKYPYLSIAIEDEREKIFDLAENKLVAKIKKGSESMIALALKTQGKKKRYVEKQEIEHSGSIEEKVRNMTEEERQKRIEQLKGKLKND